MNFDKLENMDEVRGFEKALMMIVNKGFSSAVMFRRAEEDRLSDDMFDAFRKECEEHDKKFEGFIF